MLLWEYSTPAINIVTSSKTTIVVSGPNQPFLVTEAIKEGIE